MKNTQNPFHFPTLTAWERAGAPAAFLGNRMSSCPVQRGQLHRPQALGQATQIEHDRVPASVQRRRAGQRAPAVRVAGVLRSQGLLRAAEARSPSFFAVRFLCKWGTM